ncbi:sortase domain-containing protein [Okibacterium fritillariae]|uniref:LPXTG-site transpeptidase (Sortase) family protein n=1 Tax=Okibacterium fritillariae TaxID=123320 RepID=A0A1T5IRC6_9MICO|nr:sortase [Okibacterium fritillariae]SKC41701.1 LPXTG-site transpeptidase (sortase) family protein [Okibacterium fritillariae]
MRATRRSARAVLALGVLAVTAAVVPLTVAAPVGAVGVGAAEVGGVSRTAAESGAFDTRTVAAGPLRSAAIGNGSIGILRIPRLGGDYAQEIGEGVSERTVLNTRIGHFPGTAAAGEVGNFALAGHRTSHHAPLLRINELVVGDEILVETATSNIVYKFRSLEYVSASAIDVTWPTPRSESPATTGTITFVACNPLRSTAERIIVYGVLDRVTPK